MADIHDKNYYWCVVCDVCVYGVYDMCVMCDVCVCVCVVDIWWSYSVGNLIERYMHELQCDQ